MLSGAANFRAVKPYAAADGRHLRANTIYRSGELSRLSDADLETLAGLNIQLVCDLRTGREQAEYVSRWPDGGLHRFLELPDQAQSDAGPQKFYEMIAAQPSDSGALKAMDNLYRGKPRVLANALRILLQAILAGDALPVLIHCHAGKDRTGFITAMLLAACGIGRENILEDYVTTALYFRPEQESGFFASWAKKTFALEFDTMAIRPLVDARAEYLDASFEEIVKGWGSVEDYLREEIGLDSDSRTRLQFLLLV